jgi:DNA-binding MarR family transcriptional regulator
LVTRTRDQQDRRVVMARITPEGLRLLAELDGPMVEVDRRSLDHMGEPRLRSLIALLEAARERERG